jgi:RNA polymerase primary sigma factor
LSKIIQDKSSTKNQKTRAREELILSNLRAVVKIALSVYNKLGGLDDTNVSISDLIQAGNISLMRAADLFSFKKDLRFITYAHLSIERGIMRAVKGSRLIRIPPNFFRHAYNIKKLEESEDRKMCDEEVAKKLHLLVSTVKNVRQTQFSKVCIKDESLFF